MSDIADGSSGADLLGRRALVTGGARGIGYAIAERFIAGGASVVLADVDEAVAVTSARELGDRAHAVRCDVRSTQEVADAVTATVDVLGGLDVLVNNAGIEVAAPLVETSEEDFARVLDINVTGTFRCTKAAVPAMVASGGGAIVNLSSVAGTGGSPLLAAYCASKGAVIRLTEVAAIELRDAGVRVNAVCPGLIGTEMAARLVDPLEAVAPITFDEIIALKQGRLGTPEEVAEMVAFLAGDEARFMTGTHNLIDGGLTAGLL